MKFGFSTEQLDSITKIFSLHPNLDKAIIFGSRAKGNYYSGSDIDIALFGENLRLNELFQLGTELEDLSLPINFDLILYNGLLDQEVIEHIKRAGKLFYKRKELREHGLCPLINENSRILILGTFPSDQSLLREQYYANPTNQFWKILFKLYNRTYSLDYKIRFDLIFEKRIALWDVIESCLRNGSSDNKIKDEVVNKFDQFFIAYPNLTHLIFNGLNSYMFFFRHHINADKFVSSLTLASTSFLNTHLTLEEKTQQWSIIKDILG